VIIFLSDGECGVTDERVQDVCRRALALGSVLSQSLAPSFCLNDINHRDPLSFHTVAFGDNNAILQRMVDLATDIQNRAPPNQMRPSIPSSYSLALDSVSSTKIDDP
jgi:hypothetical protein